jgi:hypothetical protein
MKTIHYVIIAQHLTGDSMVKFFHSKLAAENCFIKHVQPCLTVCIDKELVEDEAYYLTRDGKGYRFNSGYDDDLDAAMETEGADLFIYTDSVEVDDDVTHYVAEFAEYVDETTITFHNKEKAIITWNDRVDEEIVMANTYHNHKINRYDQNTWERADGMTLFQETHYSDIHADAYFGHADMTWTTRISEIVIEE